MRYREISSQRLFTIVSVHRQGHSTAKLAHLLRNSHFSPHLILWQQKSKVAMIRKGIVGPYSQKWFSPSTLKTFVLSDDGRGSTGRWSVPSAKEKGIPHIIPCALGAVTWSFLFGSVTVQSSDTVIFFFNYYTTSPMSYWQHAGGIYITFLFSFMYFFF